MDRCKHCLRPVMEVNYALDPRWMHYTPGAAFQDGLYEFCHLSVATPTDSPEEASA